MKRFIRFATVLIGSTLLLVGCGKSSSLDTSKLSAGFQGAPTEQKSGVDAAVKAIGSGDFATAAESLKKAVKGAKLSPEQKTAVSEVVAEMQKVASQDPGKYPLETYYSIGEVITVMEGLPVIRRNVTPSTNP